MKNSDAVEHAILGAANPQEKDIIRRVVTAGREMMNDEQLRSVSDEMLNGEGDPSRNLGEGIAHVILVLYDKSRRKQPAQPAPTGLINAQAGPQPAQPQSPATMPLGALVPAGAILLSNVANFSGKQAIMDVAMQAMFVKIYDRFDPTFRDKVASKTGAQPATAQQPPSAAQDQPQPGLINAGGM